ncbi:MAG: hypothetical protein HOH14_03865 [Gammaproteobacteria bacterium]|nr:hypothetical protein [Gammaproteobacteria bacterium]MBT6042613.1 hypothetical protein [Gammaproteobacteria bacterium]
MTKKMNKKTRNVISGILVSIAAIFAVINFADIPASDVRDFIFSTGIFFIGIVLLALIAVSLFKLLIWIKNTIVNSFCKAQDEDNDTETDNKTDNKAD